MTEDIDQRVDTNSSDYYQLHRVLVTQRIVQIFFFTDVTFETLRIISDIIFLIRPISARIIY